MQKFMLHYRNQSLKIFYLIFCLFLSISVKAQITETDNTMLWTTLGVSKKLNNKFSLSYYQLHSFSINDSRFNFIQADLNLNYKFIKKWTLSGGYTPTFSFDEISGNQLIYHRIKGRIKYRSKIGKRIRMSNSITVEQHFTQRSKFKQRYYYRLDLYYRNTKWPWRLRPFLNQKLYWYANGRPLQYYNTNGDKTDLISPDGLHAYRLKLGIRLYPSDNINFSIYYQKQKEFNTDIFGSRDINSLNPNSNSIRRSFYDYSVIGISCNYKL